MPETRRGPSPSPSAEPLSDPSPAEFVQIGVFDREVEKGPARVALHAAGTPQGSRRRSPERAPKLDDAPA